MTLFQLPFYPPMNDGISRESKSKNCTCLYSHLYASRFFTQKMLSDKKNNGVQQEKEAWIEKYLIYRKRPDGVCVCVLSSML